MGNIICEGLVKIYRFVVISFNEFLTNQIYYLSFIFDTRKSNTANVFSRKMAFHK